MIDSRPPVNRRQFLEAVAGVATAATISIAGCSATPSEVSVPTFPESRLDGWKQIDSGEETLFEASVEADAHWVVYEDSKLRQAVVDEIGQLEHPVSVIVASRVALSDDLEQVLAVSERELLSRAEKAGRNRFEAWLTQLNIENIERSETSTITVSSGDEAIQRRYMADRLLEEANKLAIDVDAIPVTGDLITWRHNNSILIAGAIYPAETLASTIERTGREASEVEDGFDPATYRNDVRSILTNIE